MTMTGTRNEMKKCANKIQLLYQLLPNYYQKDDELSSDQETKKHGTGPSPTNLMGMEYTRRRNDDNLERNWTSSAEVPGYPEVL